MESEKITVPREEYENLKKKERIADDLVLQMEASLRDLEEGNVEEA